MAISSRKKRTITILTCIATLLAIGVGVAAWKSEQCVRLLLYHRPIRYDQQSFHKAIDRADRLVIREGFERDPVLLLITNAADIRELTAHLEFKPLVSTNIAFDTCMCGGFPGIDWYAGSRRLATTSVQHSRKLRWRGFSTARILGRKIIYGDAPLTKDSAQWLKEWLKKYGIGEDGLLNASTVNEAVQRNGSQPIRSETNRTSSAAGSRR